MLSEGIVKKRGDLLFSISLFFREVFAVFILNEL
jgi:hypothetical protein